jgi:hypothetical protein
MSRVSLRYRDRHAAPGDSNARRRLGTVASDSTGSDSAATWRSWYGRTNGYEASVDLLPAQDITFVLLTNLQSAVTWQLREQVRNLLSGSRPVSIRRPPPVGPAFESSGDFVGLYGDAADPVRISLVRDRLFRDENEFYPVQGNRYAIPASGSTMHFVRDAAGLVKALVTVNGSGRETLLPRLPPP